jgi:hypothetical protein
MPVFSLDLGKITLKTGVFKTSSRRGGEEKEQLIYINSTIRIILNMILTIL